MRSRWSAGSMPSMNASLGSAPGPTPSMTRPWVRWSSSTMRWAVMKRVVVGERHHPGAERMRWVRCGRGGDEDLGRGDDLVAAGVVLADPGLVEAEAVEVLDQGEVAVEGEGGVLAGRGGTGP